MDRIPVAGPWITDREVEYVTDAARNAWYANANTYIQRFETAFSEYLDVRHAVSLPSATSGLHLALAALDVGPGDEVVVPDITWIATAAPISYLGAQPVFADVDRTSWCITAQTLESCICERTKAVIVVDLYGNVAEMAPIRRLAERHGIAIVEDAAEAVGGMDGRRKAGSLGDLGVFSFHGTKTLTTGEGGMVVTDDDALFRRIRFLRDHARVPGGKVFWNTEVAFKYKMSGLQAALGLAQTERIEELIDRKRETFEWYSSDLDGTEGVTLNSERPGTRSTYWMVTAVLDASLDIPKETVMEELSAREIDSRPFFYPLSELPAYAGTAQAQAARSRNHVSYDLSWRAVNLPSALSLTRDQVARVCAALKEIMREHAPLAAARA